ncbi:MAG TPA: MFS transporter [Solirubrobacteraceae bacterium]|jgi:EmrB/QacA subfamily drug resistance transporter|nr:MFS transporter [Solirubrobacteraceae bacterium]
MIFAVAMLFIDQTIVALAVPNLQHELHLSSTGSQWIVNGYLLSLSALFALGGKVADVFGPRRMVTVGVIAFALCSALCGATPTGSIAETWLIVFRVLQGAAAAILFPAALAIVVASYPVAERGKALAVFFSITGALTAVGPIAGGYLTEWTWRAIFWVNIPVAIVALVLIAVSKPAEERSDSRIDVRGALLVGAGMGIAVLGLQQASVWGWSSLATWLCLVVGVALLAAFVRYELRVADPLVPMRLFADRAFLVDNVVLFLLSICFVPLFFFASLYAQIALGENAGEAGLYILVFFIGFTIGAQRGGRLLDSRGARPTVVPGCIIAAVGFYLWAEALDDLSFNEQWWRLAIAGLGVGMVLGPVSTDALNRAAHATYGAVTGLTQTVRNFGGSLGLAVLGSLLISETVSRVTKSLTSAGVPKARAEGIAHAVSGASRGSAPASSGGGGSHGLTRQVRLDFAHSTQVVVYGMAAAMALAFVVALRAMPGGRPDEQRAEASEGSQPGSRADAPSGEAAAAA